MMQAGGGAMLAGLAVALAADDSVDPQETRRIVAALRARRAALGLDPEGVRMTLYPDLNHGCWATAYDEPELPAWLLAPVSRP